ncbi:hypothetical protein ACS0TY_028498 [Phlomoides rotata]
MDSVRNTVCYCCIWKGGRVLYSYSIGDHGIDNLAALCLETIPPYHRWYFETIGDNTFGFLMEDGYAYFAIVRQSFGNSQLLRFLEKLKDEFTRIGSRGRSITSLDSLCLQEQLIPVVNNLVASLQRADNTVWPSPSPPGNGHIASTKAPLLGRPSKHEKKKKKMKDHAIFMRDVEMEEHRRSSSARVDSGPLDTSDDQGASSASPLHKDHRSSQNLHKKWCRQVRIVLAIDAAVCVVLLIIWLVICHGVECIR